MKKILHFGLFDINNYGDLLFPLIAERELKDISGFNLSAVAPVGRGAMPLSDVASCVSVLDVIAYADDIDAILIGGGNIISALPSEIDTYVDAGRECLAYSDLWVGPTFFFPKYIPIVWNAPSVLGPFSNAQHSLVKSALLRTNYLSVRDEESRQYLLDVLPNADIAVVPDSVWRINKLWSAAELKLTYEALFARLNKSVPARTVVFHFNQRYLGQRSIQAAANRLDEIAKQLDAQPILIALDLCDDDEVLAQEVGVLMSSRPVILHNPQSLREVVACFAFTDTYVGSSICGFMIASAFNVPSVAVVTPEMMKSSGVAGWISMPEIMANNWDQVIGVLKSRDVEKYKIELGALYKKIDVALDKHWGRIRLEFQELHAHSLSIATSSSWRKAMDYQNKVMATILETTKEMQEIASAHDIAAIVKQRDALSMRVSIVENSIVWRASHPIRMIPRKFPIIRSMAVKMLKAASWLCKKRLKLKVNSEMTCIEWAVPDNLEQQIKVYKSSALKKKKIVFYTAIIGNYDALFLPEVIHEDIDYVCFTDQPKNDYGIWQIHASPYYDNDPTRIARYIKTHPHLLFPDHDIAIWIDANVILCEDVKKYIAKLDDERVSLGMIPHPLRDCVYKEAAACKLSKKDDHAIIDKQMDFYRKNALKNHGGLFETNFMIIRLADRAVLAMFRFWWQQIQTFSRRDQLALPWALHCYPVPIVNLLPKNISVREHIDFQYHMHTDSRQRRLPAKILQLGQLKNPFDDTPFIRVKEKRLSKVKNQTIDIIVCVYNALEDVKLCLQSARQFLLPAHRIIIVNDGSDALTTEYLREFAADDKQVMLIENETNLGYVSTANRGLENSTASFCIILNSDTIVNENWAIKMLDIAIQDPEIGVVSPLSNAAGSQSLPEIKSGKNNTAINMIPKSISIADVDHFLETISLANTVPYVSLAHGFCFGIKREVIETIGLFDTINFARYYGEENDYCFRASTAGFCSAIATNTFVYHRKSRSISEEERIIYMGKAGQKLRELYGVEAIRMAGLQGRDHPLLQRIRSQISVFYKNASKNKNEEAA